VKRTRLWCAVWTHYKREKKRKKKIEREKMAPWKACGSFERRRERHMFMLMLLYSLTLKSHKGEVMQEMQLASPYWSLSEPWLLCII